ncbi:MAG: T9SS type A sorting domain-containing protein, partial [Cyclobacteriaceae bacterium]
KDNILVNPGQYGIAIAGGSSVQLIDNSIYGKQQSFTNVGLYVWNQDTSVSCANHIIAGNRVNWTNNNGKKNPSWNANNCGTIAGWDNNIWNANISSDILPENILPDSLCDEKANCTDCPQVPSCNITIEAEIVDATDDHTNGSIDIKISGGINPYIYDWSDGYTTKDRTNLQQGTYTLTVTDSNGCIASNSWSIEDNSSNKDGDLVSTPMANNEKQLFNIYPNPATQFFTIELIENGIVRIFDISGRKVFQKYMHRGKHSFTTEFPKGCYVVSVHLDNSLINKQKLIIK